MSTPTANYGWAKPTVGGDGDAWGGELNTSLDGIDSTVKTVSNAIPLASSTTPVMNGAAAVGVGTTWARADHVHPTDTSLYPASNPSGYQTAAQVTAAIPVASSTPPIMDGTAAVGTGTTWARADHSHPTDSSRYAASNPSGYQTAAQVTTSLAPYALLASPIFTGAPSLPTGTTGITQAAGNNSTALATTAFVSALPVAMNDNRIINGDMRIDQRNNGASGTAAGVYTIDRWIYYGSQPSKMTWGQNIYSLGIQPGFPYYLGVGTTSAYTPAASETFQFHQGIEADMVSDFAWGTANAQPVTLSFWAKSSLTGTFGGAIQNWTGTRSYPFTYSLPTANTWTKAVITIPGDTVGTWVMNGNAGSLYVIIGLGAGATVSGPAGAWASTAYNNATGAVKVVAIASANFCVTGVKLEIGSIATPFNRQSLAKSMADCRRYYQVFPTVVDGSYSSLGGTPNYRTITLSPPMRAAPTMTFGTTGYNNTSGLNSYNTDTIEATYSYSSVAVGNISVQFAMALSAEL